MRAMSLQTKSLLVISVIIAIATALNFGVLRGFVFPSFVSLEEAENRRNMERVLEAFDREIADISATNRDWATWNDTLSYAAGEYEQYETDNLYLSAFSVRPATM